MQIAIDMGGDCIPDRHYELTIGERLFLRISGSEVQPDIEINRIAIDVCDRGTATMN
jgi:hypothetical protein